VPAREVPQEERGAVEERRVVRVAADALAVERQDRV